jgi:hypothetical protein
MYEIIWHGRDSQNLVKASPIIPESVYLQNATTFRPSRDIRIDE